MSPLPCMHFCSVLMTSLESLKLSKARLIYTTPAPTAELKKMCTEGYSGLAPA